MSELLLWALELELPLAGHGYQLGEQFGGERDRADGPDGLSMPYVLGVLLLVVATCAILVWLNPSLLTRIRGVAPKALILIIIAAPLIGWTLASRVNEKVEPLVVEQWTNAQGVPELLISLGGEKLNRLDFTAGKRVVHIECYARNGTLVIAADQKWPFVFDKGYDYPHAHQKASREELVRVNRCRVIGARSRLEAVVKGVLAR